MSLTTIDWLGFRTKSPTASSIQAIRGVFGKEGKHLQAKPRKSGWQGYTHSADLSLMGMHVGLIAFGGVNQKDWSRIDISAAGCKWVEDWEQAQESLYNLADYQTRRIDIALDTFKREVTHEKVVQAYRDGLFTTSGKPPSMTRIEPENPYDGSSAYVGKRTSDKFFRGYTKGYELVRQFPDEIISHINGIPIDDIYRCELEIKAKMSPIPVDIIENRDGYFAGAYPYLQTVIASSPIPFKPGRSLAAQLDLEAALSNIRRQYGNTLFTALAAYGGDVGALMDRVIGTQHNQALIAAGVLTTEHYGMQFTH